jgi:elongation factor Ts
MSTIEDIKKLRELTNAGMSDCKNALAEANGDLDKAVDLIKVKGKLIAESRSSKVANEGLCQTCIVRKGDMTFGVLVEVNCQTDFVANSADFKSFVNNFTVSATLATSLGTWTGTPEKFIQTVIDFGHNGEGHAKQLEDLMATTKEKVEVRRVQMYGAAPNEVLGKYIHTNGKLGVLVKLEGEATKEVVELADNIAMHIAAMNPLAVASDSLNQEEVDRQNAIFEEQMKGDNKPPAIKSKILAGKLNKWYTEVCLLNQESVWEEKQTVEQVLAKHSNVKVLSFTRFQVGEGIEKETVDFAEEVMKLSQ